MKRLSLLLGFLLLAAPAFSVPAMVTQKYADLKKVGEAEYSVLFLDVYKISLYQTQMNPQVDILHIEYDMDLTAEKRINSGLSDMKKQAKFEKSQLDHWESQMRDIFPEVKEGDAITLEVVKPNLTRFYHNNNLRGQINDGAFTQAFSGIWLGERSPHKSMRKKLLKNALHK